ncbi:MAG: hypothetical protein H7066_17115 [Cytophagaceae bacterium]|nr:hypothetical protein [Gemmatimonadaceae bacterium]
MTLPPLDPLVRDFIDVAGAEPSTHPTDRLEDGRPGPRGRTPARRPGLPVVVMSGCASGRKAGEKEMLAREHFLAKPFTTESLLVQVRVALTGSSAANLLR